MSRNFEIIKGYRRLLLRPFFQLSFLGLPLLSGVMVGTSYIPFPPWALLFCYSALWLWFTDEKNQENQTHLYRRIFLGGWVTQFVLSLIGFHWIAYTAHEFGGFPYSLSIITLILFAALVHLYIPLVGVIGIAIQKKFSLSRSSALFVFAIVHAMLERIWPSIFPWHLGYPLMWVKLPMYHLAEWIGFNGLSCLVLLSSSFFAWLWLKISKGEKVFKPIAIYLTVFTLLNITGFQLVQKWHKTDAKIDVLITQANIGNQDKIYAEKGGAYQIEILNRFSNLTTRGLQQQGKADLIVWPETAFPDYLNQMYLRSGRQMDLVQNIRNWQTPLLVGGYSKDPPDKQPRQVYNALFLLNENGDVEDKPYHKTELLAFGEYLPLSEQFPFLLKLLPFIANFGRGQGPEPITWNIRNKAPIKIGGQICYEGLSPAFSRGLAEKGAHILVNVTNDSWFGVPFETNQHMIMTLARAIEIRRPLIRSTNTGISTVIQANGEIAEKSPTLEEWVGNFEVRFLTNPNTTFFTDLGHLDWVLWLFVLIFIIWKGRNVRKKHPPAIS